MISRAVRIFLLVAFVFAGLTPQSALAEVRLQTATPELDVAQIVSRLSPEEKVGQLFLVTFRGTAVDDTAPIVDLITRYHVSGVVLLTSNDNFTDQDFAAATHRLTTNLQAVAAGVIPNTGISTPATADRQYIPLFIAARYSEAGVASPLQLPTAMTLGGTWSVDRTEAIGQLAGQNLAALGINMLFGPLLDVVERPQPLGPADQGARVFGGNAYWVGKLGQAFIKGLHAGSQNHVAVVAQHFPGYGAGDRTLGEQIPAVTKSRQELLAVDLAPFFQVATNAPGSADALQVSHIRYSGLQGPLTDSVKPISLDQVALTELLNLPGLAPWRANGGLTVTDALGARALRRFQDPTERNFLAFAAARDAFLAGNDLLYTAGFEQDGEDPTATLKTVLAQFVQKYAEDASFAARVNEAVARIIALKLKLYNDFSFETVVSTTGNLDLIGANSAEVLAASSSAAALLGPTGLSSRPSRGQTVLFITDTRLSQVCSSCELRPTLAVDALQEEVLRLYGPRGTGEVNLQSFVSLSFVDVLNFLENRVAPTETPPPPGGDDTPAPPTNLPPPNVELLLRNANWVVFGMLDVKSSVPESLVVRRLLAERFDLLRGKQIVAFAFDAPYYLDATEVSQLTAYYGLYNHTPAALQVAAQILFQEITPNSAPPISIPATGYNLSDALQPDPNQDIRLFLETAPAADATPAPSDATPTPSALGVAVTLHTGVILDRRGHPVPDGTLVTFSVTYVTQGITNPVPFAQAPTVNGVATTIYRLDKIGTLEFTAASGLAQRSDRIGLDVENTAQGVGTITVIAPPSRTPTATVVPSITPLRTSTPVVTTTPGPPQPPQSPVSFYDFLLTLATLAVMGLVAARVTRSRTEAVSDGVKLFLVIAIGALVGYNYYALKLPGYDPLHQLGGWAVPFVVWSGGLVGFGVGWWWLRRSPAPRDQRAEGDE